MSNAVQWICRLFVNDYYMPHGHCYLWNPPIVWGNVIPDGLIALSYYSIPLTLWYFTRKRQDLPFRWMFWLFGGFIIACGTTHIMEVYNVWNGSYALAAGVKIITAALSMATAVLLVRLIPLALKLPSPTALEKEISERKQTEIQLRHSQEQILQLQKLEGIGRLAGGIAHDFNNLLTGIIGIATDLEERTQPNDDRFIEIQEIRKAGERAATLTKQLLAFSRKQVVAPTRLGVNKTVTDMAHMLRRLIGEDVDLQLNLDPHAGEVHMDPSQMEQIIVNLTVNARDAMPQGGLLVVKTGHVLISDEIPPDMEVQMAEGHYVSVAVTDNGTGMRPEIRSKIFEPFFTTKEQGKGTGLGLATVYGIVKQNNGGITVYTSPGVGTSIKVFIPRFEFSEGGSPQKEPQDSLQPVLGGTERILVVEDEPLVASYTVRSLSRHGYHVMLARSGVEALALIKENRHSFDVVLTDVVMPGMNGKQLANEVKFLLPDAKIMFMSGYPEEVIARHGVLDTQIHFIEKPFTTALLCRKVRAV